MTTRPTSVTRRHHGLSRIVFGMWRLAAWQLTTAQTRALIEAALERGITSFDHADIYGDYDGEALFGRVLQESPALRERMQLVSKCGIRLVNARRPEHHRKTYDTTRAHLLASVDNSLKALATDHLDLLLIHRPSPLMDADEIAEAFTHLRASGKVRAFGVSNFTPAQFALLDDRIELVTNQVECSLLHPTPLFDGTFDQAQALRCEPMLWSPLAGGRLFDRSHSAADRVGGPLERIAADIGATPGAVALAWLLALPCRPLPVIGSHRAQALDDAVTAMTLELGREPWFELLAAAQGQELP